jgi:hypothetical protein
MNEIGLMDEIAVRFVFTILFGGVVGGILSIGGAFVTCIGLTIISARFMSRPLGLKRSFAYMWVAIYAAFFSSVCIRFSVGALLSPTGMGRHLLEYGTGWIVGTAVLLRLLRHMESSVEMSRWNAAALSGLVLLIHAVNLTWLNLLASSD